MTNDLAKETSPYLLQHKDNPVEWMAWGTDALARAKAEDKPILLSVGYAACHWCHVMAHESFETPHIAEQMNKDFINIKVDREERPDIDSIYQSALQKLGEQGGWPLTMFLTPDGEPYWGGTYFPPTSKFGRPGFDQVLKQMANVYRSQRDNVVSNKNAILDALRADENKATANADAHLSGELLDRMAERLIDHVDAVHGGMAGAPKFPIPPLFQFFWRAYLRTGDAKFRDGVILTLDRMCQGGIYDHVGGGFARYSTDEQWLAPHFEKMLYDNALLVELMATVWPEIKNPLYEVRTRETLDWNLREMIADGGAFAAAWDADSEGVEGKFYVWSESEIDSILGSDSEVFKAAYNVSANGNWEDSNILNRTALPALCDAAHEQKLSACRAKLFDVRKKRVAPLWDDKVLADWNGLMIAAMVLAGRTFSETAWVDAAKTAFNFIADNMSDGDRLFHSYRLGQARHAGMLDDYANMARAALLLFEVTGDESFVRRAAAWTDVLNNQFADPERGGFCQTAADGEALIIRVRSAHDMTTPSGNGTMVEVLARLYHHTGIEAYQAQAEDLVRAFSGEVEQNFFPLTTFLNGFDFLDRTVQVAILGDPEAEDTLALLTAVEGASLPTKVVRIVAKGESLPPGHPASGMTSIEGAATAYLCLGATCSLPMTSPQDLLNALPAP
jgi:uncharacterized protein YyaL (SSP411 family)